MCWARRTSPGAMPSSVWVGELPTTLLAMVDAAIGGKTGINTDEGKNLVGAFHPPAGVLCDLTSLETLPVNDRSSGLGEVAKHGFIADERTLELIEADPSLLTGPELTGKGAEVMRELVERSVAIKAGVVSQDLRVAV